MKNTKQDGIASTIVDLILPALVYPILPGIGTV